MTNREIFNSLLEDCNSICKVDFQAFNIADTKVILSSTIFNATYGERLKAYKGFKKISKKFNENYETNLRVEFGHKTDEKNKSYFEIKMIGYIPHKFGIK